MIQSIQFDDWNSGRVNKLSISCFLFCLYFCFLVKKTTIIVVVVVVVARCYLLLFVCLCLCCCCCWCTLLVFVCFFLLLLFWRVTKLDPVPLGLMFFCTIYPEAFCRQAVPVALPQHTAHFCCLLTPSFLWRPSLLVYPFLQSPVLCSWVVLTVLLSLDAENYTPWYITQIIWPLNHFCEVHVENYTP